MLDYVEKNTSFLEKKGHWLWPTSYKGRCLISLWLVFLYHSLIYYNLILTSESGHEIKKGHGLNCQKKAMTIVWKLSGKKEPCKRLSIFMTFTYWNESPDLFRKTRQKIYFNVFQFESKQKKARKVYRFSDPDKKKIIKHTNDMFMETFGM